MRALWRQASALATVHSVNVVAMESEGQNRELADDTESEIVEVAKKSRVRRMAPWAIPAVLIIVLLGPHLIGNRSLFPAGQLFNYAPWDSHSPADAGVGTHGPFSDIWDSYMPGRMEGSDRLANLDLPLWESTNAGGGDLTSHLGSTTIAPTTLLYIALPDWYAPGFQKALEVLGAWGFIYLFIRRRGAKAWGASIGGLVFALSGFQIVWINWPHTMVNMLVAANLWSLDRLRESPKDPWRIATAAIFVAAVLLEGFPAVAVIGLVAVATVLLIVQIVSWPGWAKTAWAAGAGIAALVLGLGLSAIVLAPFRAKLSMLELARDFSGQLNANRGIATVLAPNAFGPADRYFGPLNYVEVVGYLSPVVLPLLLAGTVVAIKNRKRAWLTASLVGIGSVMMLFSYGFEPIHSALSSLPLLSSNPAMRMKATAAILLAVAAGLGVDALIRSQVPVRWRLSILAAATATCAASAGFLYYVWRNTDPTVTEFTRGELIRACAMLGLGLACTAAIMWAKELGKYTVPIATTAVLVLMLIDATLWIRPYWPSSYPRDFYPATEAHDFLAESLGDDRLASLGATFWGGTATAYDYRTLNGHQFQSPEWKELVTAAGGTYVTNTFLGFGEPTAASNTTLDRMGVTYFAEAPSQSRCTAAFAGGTEELTVTAGVEIGVLPEGARALRVQLAEAVPQNMRMRVTTGDGREATTTITSAMPVGHEIYIHIPSAGGGGDTPVIVEEIVPSDPEAAPNDGPRALGFLVPERSGETAVCFPPEDGLDSVFANGAVIYRREGALPRARWASGAVVAPDSTERLELMGSEDLSDDLVVLHSGSATESTSGTGEVISSEDLGDSQRYETTSTDDGYLVVMDPMQNGWTATLDGEPAELLSAEHAGVAVAVPSGDHAIVLTYEPAGLGAGKFITALSLLIVLGLGAAGLFLRRRSKAPAISQDSNADN